MTTTDQWEELYLARAHDHAVGRLFQGVLHNVNGVFQALSMQAELLELTLARIEACSRELADSAAGGEIAELAAQRRALVAQMVERLQIGRRISGEAPAAAPAAGGTDLAAAVADGVALLEGWRFFKHQVAKEIQVPVDLRVDLPADRLAFVLRAVLQNAGEALEAQGGGTVRLAAHQEEGRVVLTVTDDGSADPDLDEERIFTPFVSTKAGHPGVELYLVRKILAGAGGGVQVERVAGRTTVTLLFPAA